MQHSTTDRAEERSGLIAGFAAFITWGLVPVYWKLLKAVPAQEILAHRFVWTALFLILLISWQRRWTEVRESARSATSHALLPNEWNCDRDKLVLLHLGRECRAHHRNQPRLFHDSARQCSFRRDFSARTAHPLATDLGLARDGGGLEPDFWLRAISLDRARSLFQFGVYGLLRKKSGTRAIPGLFFETIALVPIAIIYLLILHRTR